MSTVEKLKTSVWFLARPHCWAQGLELGLRKARPDYDRAELRAAAVAWASDRAVPVPEALTAVGSLTSQSGHAPSLSKDLLAEARRRAACSAVRMGGSGDVDLLYAATVLSGAERVVETGVAYGWSSLAILAALEGRAAARLVSVDMPYPKMNNEDFVGIVVPQELRGKWTLIREPDRNGLVKALERFGGRIDLCHYDSDKSWWGRQFSYPLLWNALKPGGVFISDDIQDNFAFRDFVEGRGLDCAVTGYEGKFVGIVRKPHPT